MIRSKSFVRGLLSGLAPASVFERSRYPSLKGSDMSRMRADVGRVGQHFATVISREENGQKAHAASGTTRSK